MARRLTYRDRKKLLEDHQSGVSNTELKTKFGIRDKRTLERHLQLGEHEQEARLVRVGIVKEALAGHHAKIRSLIEHWQGALSTPQIHEVYPGTRRPTQDVEADPLFVSLREHLPFPTLWRNYSVWAGKIDKYIESCQGLSATIEKKVKEWKSVEEATLHVARPILVQISSKVQGKEPKAHEFNKSFLMGSDDEYLVVVDHGSVDGGLNVLRAKDTAPYRKLYQALSTQVLDSEEATKLIALFKELRALEPKIHDSLQEILLRYDYIMYTCRLCPGQARLSH